MNRSALLVVSFGTAYGETREKTIEAIEADLRAAFPERAFYRAWTSGMLRRKVLAADGLRIDSVPEALERALADGVADLLVQPTHMMAGQECEAVRETLREYAPRFDALSMGEPLLTDAGSVSALAEAVLSAYGGLGDDELLALMGHGSAKSRFAPYAPLDVRFAELGHANVCVGTVEFEPGIAPVLARVEARKPRRVYIAPLMVVAGDHAVNDMAGDDPDSWRSRIGALGVETRCVLRGLGEYEAVRRLYVARARRARAVQAEAAGDEA